MLLYFILFYSVQRRCVQLCKWCYNNSYRNNRDCDCNKQNKETKRYTHQNTKDKQNTVQKKVHACLVPYAFYDLRPTNGTILNLTTPEPARRVHSIKIIETLKTCAKVHYK